MTRNRSVLLLPLIERLHALLEQGPPGEIQHPRRIPPRGSRLPLPTSRQPLFLAGLTRRGRKRAPDGHADRDHRDDEDAPEHPAEPGGDALRLLHELRDSIHHLRVHNALLQKELTTKRPVFKLYHNL